MIVLILVAALSAGPSAPVDAARAPSSAMAAEAYAAELDRLARKVEALKTEPQTAEQLRQSLPAHWEVAERDSAVTVDTGFLRQALETFQKSPPDRKRVLLDQMERRLSALRAENTGFLQTGRSNTATRRRLDRILATRQFSSVQAPSLLEIWRNKVVAVVQRWLTRASEKMPEVPGLGRAFVWLAIAMASAVLAVSLYRYARQRPPEIAREVVPFAPSARSWRLWLADADAQAAQGNYREAVHLAYWAGVSYLEVLGLWRPDRSRTPREYLKAVAGSHPSRAPFSALTRRFEAVWYGGRTAAAPDFQQTRAELERLGCR